MKHIQPNQQGFTILELLIATTVFSVILVLVTTGILQIGKSYYKGIAQERTQETARSIMDEISRGIQFSGETVIPTTPLGPAYPAPGAKYGFCVNGVGYAYIMDKQLVAGATNADQENYTLISYPAGTCVGFTPADVTGLAGKELLAQGMRLTDLEVRVIDPIKGIYTITVGVATGEFGLFNTNGFGIHDSCKSGGGQQFCAVSKLTTTVLKRVK